MPPRSRSGWPGWRWASRPAWSPTWQARIYTVAELVNSYLSAAGKRRPLVPVHIPGQAARAIRAGANLAPDRAVGKRTWEEFLAGRI